jgi:hypothetical protein
VQRLMLVHSGLALGAPLIAEQQQPAAYEQPHPDGEHDRRGHHQRLAKLAQGTEAFSDLVLLVFGALGELVGERRMGWLDLARFKSTRPRRVPSGDGRQQPPGRLLVSLVADLDLLGEGGVVGVGVLLDEPQRGTQRHRRSGDVGSGLGALLLHVGAPPRLHARQFQAGRLPHLLLLAVAVGLLGRRVGS